MNKLYSFIFRNILKLAVFTGLSVLTAVNGYAQCPVTAFANHLSINCGDTIKLNAVADGCKPLNTNFNNGSMGPGWLATTGVSVTDCSGAYNCFGAPAEGPYCLFMGSNVAAPRDVTTNDIDLKACGSTGATICFDMKFSVQGGNGICEGPDAPGEGVSIQYSIDGGATWVTLQYWDPNGGFDPTLTTWNRYCVSVPAAAYTSSTRFRWYQGASSGVGYDTWGLDDVVITLITPGYTYDWAHDGLPPAATPATPPVTPATSTTYTVTYTNGVNTCSASVSVTVAPITATATASPAQVCVNGQSQLDVITSTAPVPPAVCGTSIFGCQGVSTSINVGTATTVNANYKFLGRAATGGFSGCTNGDGNRDGSVRIQMLYMKSEIPAFFVGGQFYNMALTANGVINGSCSGFTIKMGCTSKTSFTSKTDWVTTGMVTVLGPKNVSIGNGLNTFTFDNAFDWQGADNIIVQICFNGGGGNLEGDVNKTLTPFSSVLVLTSCAVKPCEFTMSTTLSQNVTDTYRPSTTFGICYRVPPVLSYTWAPAASLNNASIRNPMATVGATTNFTVTVSDAARPMCNVTKTVNVVAANPGLTVNPSSTTVCGGSPSSVALSSNGTPSVSGGSIVSYQWMPTTALSNPNVSNPTESPTATTTYVVKVTDNSGCTATQNVFVGYCASVPIELMSFNAVKQGKQVTLIWNTASEKNSDYFEIERSGDGNAFTAIGKVSASINSSVLKNYQFRDPNPAEGVNYYRLRLSDKDGRWKHSGVEVVSFDIQGVSFSLTRLAPIPVHDQLSYLITNGNEEWLDIKIVDLAGKTVKKERRHVFPGKNDLVADVADLEKGLYFLQAVSENGRVAVQRFIK